MTDDRKAPVEDDQPRRPRSEPRDDRTRDDKTDDGSYRFRDWAAI